MPKGPEPLVQRWPVRRDTPLLPAAFPISTESRATLTVLTGLQAGRIVATDGAPITIGRAPEADLAVDDAGPYCSL